MIDQFKSNTPKDDRDLWRTPPEVFNKLNKEFGFTMDVAASQENALCESFLTEEDDALSRSWGAVNWCNPPYSNVGPWIDHAMLQKDCSRTTVMLVNASTDSLWFESAWRGCNEVRIITRRLAFISSSTGNPVSGNSKGQALFIWRAHCKSHCVSLIDREDFYY